MVTAAQMMQHDVSLDQRPQKCLEILLRAEKEAEEVVLDIQSAITDHDVRGIELKAEAASLRAARGKQALGESARGNHEDIQGIGRHVDSCDHSPFGEDDNNDPDDSGLPKTPAGEEHLHKSRALQQRLRDCYLTLHRVKFLQGDIYHWMGERKAAEEVVAYKAADEMRGKLLKCAFPPYPSDAG
jgi:E3 ubiquitin-protein ligase SHPRH